MVAALDAELARALSPEPADSSPFRRRALRRDRQRPRVSRRSIEPPARGLPGTRGAVGGAAVDPRSRPAHRSADDPRGPLERRTRLRWSASSSTDLSGESLRLTWDRPHAARGRRRVQRDLAVSADGSWGVGVGSSGVGRWDARGWTTMVRSAPARVEPHQIRVVAMSDQGDVLLARRGTARRHDLTERDVADDPLRRGARSRLPRRAPRIQRRTHARRREHVRRTDVRHDRPDVAASGRRRSRLASFASPIAERCARSSASESDFLACGDAGALVLLRPTGVPKRVSACEAPLNALVSLSATGLPRRSGTVVMCSLIWPSLETQLELLIQTTKDLFALTRGADGTVWTGRGLVPRYARARARRVDA